MNSVVICGHCLCGEIQYEFEGAAFSSLICHCDSCSRGAGATQVAWLTVRKDHFRFLAKSPTNYASSKGVTRTFCQRCGSSLTYHSEEHHRDNGGIDVTTATLKNPEKVAPRAHIFLKDAPKWELEADKLPKFEGFPPEDK